MVHSSQFDFAAAELRLRSAVTVAEPVEAELVEVLPLVEAHCKWLIQCTVNGRYKNDANGLDMIRI